MGMLLLAAIPLALVSWIFWATLTNVAPDPTSRQSRA
jgi:hypothetical protein